MIQDGKEREWAQCVGLGSGLLHNRQHAASGDGGGAMHAKHGFASARMQRRRRRQVPMGALAG